MRLSAFKSLLLGCLFVMEISGQTIQTEFNYKSDYLSCYEKRITGETINYYALGGQSFDALLVRSLDEKEFIEWETEPVPLDYKDETLRFIIMANLQITKDSHRFDVFLNDQKYFSFNNPTEKSLNPIIIHGVNGASLEFNNLEYDRFEDLAGFLCFNLPAKDFPKGSPVRIRVVGETAQSRSWFMVFKNPCRSSVALSGESVILNTPETPMQSLRVKIMHMMNPVKAVIKIGDIETELNLKFGFNYLNAGLERISTEKELPIEFKLENETIYNSTILFKPVIPITIYLLPHSHVDIGYTHVQDEVKQIQWNHLEDAVELAEQTKNYPLNSRFKWNTEVLWALDSYLDSAEPKKREKLIGAIKEGLIGIDGIYANMLTGLCSPEEWVWLAEATRKIESICGKKIESAMISDVPGWSWSIVQSLANSGIKYLSFGINTGDRFGSVRKELGDKPFYWISPSGKEKVLTWVHEPGYSTFHFVGKSGSVAGLSVIEPAIISYANRLAISNVPYDIIPLHYTIGSDNGPVDKYLPDHVKEWNQKYASPKLVIATTSEFFKAFEDKYGKQLTELSGDITPYWEDGAASSARETAINRKATDKLTHASIMFSQYFLSEYPTGLINEAWRNVLLYDEHTWGSWNSISEPESDFTKQQWNVKRAFALEAQKQADEIYKMAIKNIYAKTDAGDAVEVFNTSQINRTDIAYLPDNIADKINSGFSLFDENGVAVPTQKLSCGSTVFFASDIPAFKSRRYYVENKKTKAGFEPVSISENILKNEFITIELDKKLGAINKFYIAGSDANLIDESNKWGLGGYLYVEGRKPLNPLSITNAEVMIKENGPLVSSWILKLNAPGCNSVEQEIKLTAGINRVEFKYTIDKQKIYSPEAVRIAFPFNIPGGLIHVENSPGYYQIEKEQIKGACKNYFTLNNYVDVSNKEYGVTLVSPDAPEIEIGDLAMDAKALVWLEQCKSGTSVYSYLMNNYWETNYCATQEGLSSYRYFIYPNKGFDPAEAASKGVFTEQPLPVVLVDRNAKPFEPMLTYDNGNVFIISMQPCNEGRAVWLALFNASADRTDVQLKFKSVPNAVYKSDLLKNKLESESSDISIDGRGFKYLLIE